AEGRLDEAERMARPLVEKLPPEAATYWGIVLGRAALAHGRPGEALEIAARALAVSGPSLSRVVVTELGLLRVEALLALGDEEAARAELRAVRERILRLAATLDGEPAAREQFFKLEPNVRTLALAQELLG